jgi:hypothetical protein
MELIKDTITSVIHDLVAKKSGAAADADPEGWVKKALTKKELRHIKVNYFKKGVLCLSVDSSAWLYNFNLQKSSLLARISKQSKTVENLKFYLGDIK